MRLSDGGCVQYDDLAGPSLFGDKLRSHGWLISIAGIALLVLSWRRGWIDPFQFWIWLPVALLFAYVWEKSARRIRRAMHDIRDGSIADINAAFRKPVPWNKIKAFSLTPAKPGSYRLRVNGFTKFAGNDAVDAEIQLSEQQADALRALLAAWIPTARI